MLKEYPKFKRGEVEEIYNNLSSKEKTLLKEYLEYRQARGITSKTRLQDVRRFIIQLKRIIQKDYDALNLQDLRAFLVLLNKSSMSDFYKNNVKADMKNFLKYVFKDWSLRFSDFDDLKFNRKKRNEKKINSSSVISKNEVDKLIKHETKVYWKCFLLLQYEGGLRTKEARTIKWSDISFQDDDITEINIFATKTKRARTIFVKETTHYLKLLKEEQENTGIKSVYVFPSKSNPNKPIIKSTVNMWFRKLTQRVLGVKKWNYLLRHSRATELYRLAKQNKIAKDTAIEFMGHSEDMSSSYTHLDKQDVEKMLREQVYHIKDDLPQEKKHHLEIQIEEQKRMIEEQAKSIAELYKLLHHEIKARPME